MRFNKNEKLVEIFEFIGNDITEINKENLSKIVTKITNPKELGMELRDRLLEIDFSEKGFKELQSLTYKGILNPNSDNELWSYTVQKFKGSGDGKDFSAEVTPNYIVNIKNGEVYNIFDTLGRMGFYNFLTDIVNKDFNNWRVVTAIDRVFTIETRSTDLEDAQSPSNQSTLGQIFKEDSFPVERINGLLRTHNISLLGSGEDLMSLAQKLYTGVITEQDIIKLKK